MALRFNPLLKSLATYPQVALDAKKAAVKARGLPLYDFGTGDPREPTPPHIRSAYLNAVPEVSQYPKVAGSLELRQAISDYAARRFGVQLDPATQILPSSGSKEVVFHMPLLVIDPQAPDRGVVFPDPGYPAYSRGALFAGGEPIAQLLDADYRQRPWDLSREQLQRTRLMWINSPHNPSGAVLGREHLRRVWELCQEHDILLVSDECYADVYADEPPPSLLEVAPRGALVLHSCSKRSGMTGYRSGFVAGDPELIAALRTLRVNPGVVPTDPTNAAAAVAWSDDTHADQRRVLLAQKKAVFTELFKALGLTLVASEATFYLWLRCPEGYDDEQYALALLDAGIVVSPGRYFGVAGGGAGFVRVAMVPPLDRCREAARIWARTHRALSR